MQLSEAVTGPKSQEWLVRAVACMLLFLGAMLLHDAFFRKRIDRGLRAMAGKVSGMLALVARGWPAPSTASTATPIASFGWLDRTFSMLTVHSFFGKEGDKKDMERRTLETYAIARWADLERKSEHAFSSDNLVVGDLNLPKVEPGDMVCEAVAREFPALKCGLADADLDKDDLHYIDPFNKRWPDHPLVLHRAWPAFGPYRHKL